MFDFNMKMQSVPLEIYGFPALPIFLHKNKKKINKHDNTSVI